MLRKKKTDFLQRGVSPPKTEYQQLKKIVSWLGPSTLNLYKVSDFFNFTLAELPLLFYFVKYVHLLDFLIEYVHLLCF
jgi:hypothetical protein